MFSVSSERPCSDSIGNCLRDAVMYFSILHCERSRAVSHLFLADRNCLARAEPRRELELVAHAFGRLFDQQMALVVVAHLEHFGRRLLAFHISFAQLQIDSDLHMTNLLATDLQPAEGSYKRIVLATRIALGAKSWRRAIVASSEPIASICRLSMTDR